MSTTNQQSRQRARLFFWLTLVFLFFLGSGACGLLYQVVWTRKLVLLFGTAAYAVSAVLSIFFLGLGLGSLWGGRLADRTRRHLLLYGVFEIAIGLWAVLILYAIGHGEAVVVSLLRHAGASRGLGTALRAAMAFCLLFPPVFLMGATLPLLAKYVNREQLVLGRRVGTLYAVNTFGAVAGCYFTGFYLLPALGYTGATLLGAAANAGIGIAAVALSLRLRVGRNDPAGAGPDPSPAAQHPPRASRRVRTVIGAYAVIGFAMLALEVVWTRLLVIVFLGTTYAYTAMLTTLLCGIAAGSLAAAWAVDRVVRHTVLLGAVTALLGIACLFTLGWIAELPALYNTAGTWDDQLAEKFRLAFRVLFLPTFLSGIAFPLAVKAVGEQREHLGRAVGRLYSANTMGGVAGALAGGFVLLPMLGAHDSILLLGCLLLAAGIYVMRACPLTAPRARLTVIMLLFGPLLFMAWSKLPADVSRALNTVYIPGDHRVLHFAEGVEGTVAVSEPEDGRGGGDRVLWINRVQATVSIERGVKMNRLQGVLPLLFDRDPEDVLFMCFGSGITAGTLALHDFKHIDAVEISEDVLGAAPLFEKDNLGVMARPRINFIVDDGRNFLLRTAQRYDVISFEPMPLALAGVSTFYSREYYELCRARLKPGGLVSQWVPLHSLTTEMVQSLVRTFATVFPECTAWFVNADLFLIGSDRPLSIDFARADIRLSEPALAAALEDAGLCGPVDVLACFLMDKDHIARFAGEGRIMRDDRPWAEFEAPKSVDANHVPASLALLAPLAQPATAILDRATATEDQAEALERRFLSRKNDMQALQYYYGGLMISTDAAEGFLESLEIDPDNCNARHYLREVLDAQAPAFTGWQRAGDIEPLLLRAERHLPGWAGLHLHLADAYHAQGLHNAAAQRYQRYLDLGGDAPRALERARAAN